MSRPVLSERCISLHSAAFSLVMFECWLFISFSFVKLERCEFKAIFGVRAASVAFDLSTLCNKSIINSTFNKIYACNSEKS